MIFVLEKFASHWKTMTYFHKPVNSIMAAMIRSIIVLKGHGSPKIIAANGTRENCIVVQ